MVRVRGSQPSLAQERSERRALRAFTLELAREAARRIRRTARPTRARTKSSTADLLTATDLRVEAFLRRRIAAVYPMHAIVAEESADLSAGVDLRRPTWFLDPVDGTTNYFRGVPHFACNIGFWDGERMLVGATADVVRRRIHWAQAGRGSFVGRTRVHVASTSRLSESVLSTGFPYDRAVNPARNNLAAFGRITPLVRDVRRLGCAGLDMAWVACGLFDGYWEHDDGPWDWAVGALLVREAGGSVTTYDGDEWRPGDTTMVASNGRLHGPILEQVDPTRSADRIALPAGLSHE
ncbi:inositol monophosphatase family protein [Nocardioides sp. YIM 152315]|uniref:inositol monophosphatase family protein n=1 Tax=Nocardioides sp. YIM 152315 TaxID=3031760 RepID=UPI0023D9DA75|nr:inositol monophosphatase family protein [Nocardioides sp. YIM 152315]MDF1605468.1 inositol monophosphatase family protein [Nocardioides sp. YIM 152315]